MKTATDLIRDYKGLLDEGVLSQGEYDFLKNKLMEQGDAKYDVGGLNIWEKEKVQPDGTAAASSAGSIIAVIIMVIIIAAMIAGCSWLFSDSGGSSPTYETYYEDDNGNGKLDKGEFNWTTDGDGQIVDIDFDGNNF